MTIGGTLSELNNLLKADDIPFYYKPSIKAVMDTIALSNSEKPNKWIPVSERLPEKGKQVLCCNKHGSVFTSAITYIEKYKDGNRYVCFGQHHDVVAWMPLPIPYKIESEEI